MRQLIFFFALLCGGVQAMGAEPALRVPPGFVVQRVAGPPAISFPMFASLDNQGRLYVTESSGNDLYAELEKLTRGSRISLLQDRDDAGNYTKSTVFAEGLTPSMGLVWHEGKLYAADPPDLVTLEDTHGDGHADKRTVILTGFGHTDNGSLHGLIFGPDGWLYFTTGNPDGYDLHGPDGSHAQGRVGALLRCRADGSGVETIARGFENLVEIVFLPDMSIIGTVTWYQLPEGGIRDALVHLLEGGQFPIHPVDATVAHLQFNRVLPPVALFPAVAHSGLEIYHGAAFPPEMRGNLFSAQHNARKIVRHRLTSKGSSYACETFDFVTTDDPDVHFSDVLQEEDGSLLIVDTGSWYVQHCPTGRIRQAPARGGIYRVSYSQTAPPAEAKTEVSSTNWLAEIRGTNATLVAAAARRLGRLADPAAAPDLVRLLRAPDLGVRLAAAEAIAHCGDATSVAAVIEALAGETDAFLEHALTFALYRVASTASLTEALEHPSPKVQRAALLLLDQAPFQAASVAAVVARLNAWDDSLRETARWVLLRHREWGDAGAAFLRSLLELSNPTESDRHALTQFLPLFATNSAVVTAAANCLDPAHQAVNSEQRAHLLEALAMLDTSKLAPSLADGIRQLLQARDDSVALPAVQATAALRIPGAEAALVTISRDSMRGIGLRLAAARELVRRQPAIDAEQMELLLDWLSATNAPATRLAAAEILTSARLNSQQILALLKAVRGDAVISPAAILDLFERNGVQSDTAVPLLDYLAASLDAGWTVSGERLAKVQAAVPEAQRAEAQALVARVAETVARQRQQLTEFAPLLRGGDFLKGEKLFFEKAQCTTCHRIWANGGQVGPDLSRIGAIRSGPDILESILVPSATIAQGYETFNVTTKDGESYTGVRAARSDNPLRLRLASGTELLLHRDQIERIDRSKVSLMPEGLLNTLTSEEVRDLLAFLQQLK